MVPPTARDAASEKPARQFVRRLEALTKTLLSRKYESAETLWRFQADLLHLQREIQGTIAAAKRAPRTATPEGLRALEELRHVRALSRRLGDAFAWLVLSLERKMIYPLSFNSRVPIAPEDAHSRALLAILGQLSGNGMGFPLIHDVTDCLRIGDVTFLKPDPEVRTLVPTTLELKTRLRARTPDGDGVRATFDLTMISPREFDVPHEGSLEATQRSMTEAAKTREEPSEVQRGTRQTRSSRSSRQMDRMTVAFDRRDAAEGLNWLGDEPSITMTIQSESNSHWPIVRRVIRNSRKSGYAGEAVEQTLFIAAFYTPEGITPETLRRADFTRDLVGSGFLVPKFGAENGIVIHSIPERESPGAQLYLPFYLYSIPKRAVLELVRGELVLIVLMNPGGLAAHLRSAGFDVSLTPGQGDRWGGLQISTDFSNSEGVTFAAELQNLYMHIREIIYEFKSVKYLIDIANAMRDSLDLAVSEPVRMHHAERRKQSRRQDAGRS